MARYFVMSELGGKENGKWMECDGATEAVTIVSNASSYKGIIGVLNGPKRASTESHLKIGVIHTAYWECVVYAERIGIRYFIAGNMEDPS